MGRRRRAQKKIKTQKKAVVSKIFKCPLCSTDGAVSCKINQTNGTADLVCRVCPAKYNTTNVNYLVEPIDVYCEWIDRFEEENAEDEDSE